ncbi:MAG: hypothetical protein M3Z05_09305 [Gemmatimonadota bacterium]|nr:hypothetical protein [Gemmatimonadota bacterium]
MELARRRGGGEVEVSEAVHLVDVRLGEHLRVDLQRDLAIDGGVLLRDVHVVSIDVHHHPPEPLHRRLAWRADIHLEVANAAVRREHDARMPPAHAWEAIDFVAHQCIGASRYAFERDRVAPQQCDEPVVNRGHAGLAAGDERKRDQENGSHRLST